MLTHILVICLEFISSKSFDSMTDGWKSTYRNLVITIVYEVNILQLEILYVSFLFNNNVYISIAEDLFISLIALRFWLLSLICSPTGTIFARVWTWLWQWSRPLISVIWNGHVRLSNNFWRFTRSKFFKIGISDLISMC